MKYTLKLNKNKDFVGLYKKGKFSADKNCVAYFRKNGRNFNRLGISTGKKTGCAVMRSRARRIIRQAYRETEEIIPKGYDIVIASRSGTADCKSYHIKRFIIKRLLPAMSEKKQTVPQQ